MIKISLNRIFILAVVLMTAFEVFAQTDQEVLAKMREVKLSENMVYEESLNADKEQAYNVALNQLTATVNSLRSENSKPNISSADLKGVVEELSCKLGNRFSVLLYLPTEKALSLKATANSASGSSAQNTSNGANGGGRITFVPQNQQNAVIQNQNNNSSNTAPSQNSSGTATPPAQNQNNSANTTPAQNSNASSQNSAPSPNSNSQNNNQLAYANTVPTPLPDDILKTLVNQDNWVEIKGFLTSYKADGRIKETGYTQSPAEVPEDAYAILIDEMYGILSILSPKNSSRRINYKTNREDSEANYSNYYIIVWYR